MYMTSPSANEVQPDDLGPVLIAGLAQGTGVLDAPSSGAGFRRWRSHPAGLDLSVAEPFCMASQTGLACERTRVRGRQAGNPDHQTSQAWCGQKKVRPCCSGVEHSWPSAHGLSRDPPPLSAPAHWYEWAKATLVDRRDFYEASEDDSLRDDLIQSIQLIEGRWKSLQ